MIAIVLIGQTGSGKTTLAKGLAQQLNIARISSGDIAREMARNDSFARAGLERGDMAPELAMRTEVMARIEEATVTTGDFIIEGFPRGLEQLYILESVPNIHPLYFVLECSTELVFLRRLIRRQRNHDHPDAVATRWRHYKEHTEPMLAVIEGSTKIRIDAMRTTEDQIGLVESAVITAGLRVGNQNRQTSD